MGINAFDDLLYNTPCKWTLWLHIFKLPIKHICWPNELKWDMCEYFYRMYCTLYTPKRNSRWSTIWIPITKCIFYHLLKSLSTLTLTLLCVRNRREYTKVLQLFFISCECLDKQNFFQNFCSKCIKVKEKVEKS